MKHFLAVLLICLSLPFSSFAGEIEDARRKLATQEQLHGEKSVAAAMAQRKLCHRLKDHGFLDEALSYGEKSLEILRQHFGETDSLIAEAHNAIGLVHYRIGNFDKALSILGQSLSIRQQLYGEDHLAVATCLNNLALVYREQFRDQEALEIYHRVLAIREKHMDPQNDLVAGTLNNLGLCYQALGNYESAEEALLRARDIRNGNGKANTRDMATVLNSLGTLARTRGYYEESRRYFEETLEILEVELSFDHPFLLKVVGNLAAISRQLGDYDAALPLYLRELEAEEKLYGSGHRQIGLTLNNLAILRYYRGELKEALPLFERSLAIKIANFGADHPDVARTRNNLSILLMDLGRLEESLAHAEEALLQREASLGAEHPDLTHNLKHLGILNRRLGRLATARAQLTRGLGILQKVLGEEHPRMSETCLELAHVCREEGQREEARSFALRAQELSREHFRMTARLLSETEALRYQDTWESSMDLLLSLAESDHAEGRRKVWDALIHSRSLVLDELMRRHGNPDFHNHELTTALEEARKEVADLAAAAHARRHQKDYAEVFRAARLRREKAERALAAESRDFRAALAEERADATSLAATLAPGQALLSLARYRDPESGKQRSLAFLCRGASEELQVIPLGFSATLDSLVEEWRAELSRQPSLISALSHRSGGWASVGRALRRKFWDPLSPALEGIEHLFLVAEGSTLLLNPATLPTEDGRFLAELDCRIQLLSTERDLLRYSAELPVGHGLLALAAPDFGLPAEDETGFAELPSSLLELHDLQEIWRNDAEYLFGSAASKENLLKKAKGCEVLHLATHGVFRDPGTSLLQSGLSGSGLALAHANESDEGLLSAEEILTMDLRGLRWVVLSACGTGLGKIHGGEGVFGLRRSFQIAGVQTMVMSLWSVRDQESRQWMRLLYKGHFHDGLASGEASWQASLSILKDRRRRGMSLHPHYWGAFVSLGNWR
ncbi:MAG: tetratricopeptide repeat protein [Candidatus Krumholzibacteria bacterium]|jgi:tetratricopeptide (TPR) repeat protein|nr:tetratricopeptide repeat protein [Candidatus Krumholzibacteria bacterium]MDP7022153.1 tetratricopeptide repeat protein [Candidatus Krumholzibacteria bacterium]